MSKKEKEAARVALMHQVISLCSERVSRKSLIANVPGVTMYSLSQMDRHGYIKRCDLDDGAVGYLTTEKGRARVGIPTEPVVRPDRFVPTGDYLGEGLKDGYARAGAGDAFAIPSMHFGVRQERRVPVCLI